MADAHQGGIRIIEDPSPEQAPKLIGIGRRSHLGHHGGSIGVVHLQGVEQGSGRLGTQAVGPAIPKQPAHRLDLAVFKPKFEGWDQAAVGIAHGIAQAQSAGGAASGHTQGRSVVAGKAHIGPMTVGAGGAARLGQIGVGKDPLAQRLHIDRGQQLGRHCRQCGHPRAIGRGLSAAPTTASRQAQGP